jgi:hypothetical protein
MSRKLTLLALLLVSMSAFARTRSVASTHPDQVRGDTATVSGIVTVREGNLISLAEGLIVIDGSDAEIVVGRSRNATVADIQPGMLVFAALRDVTTRSGGPLLARLITATPTSDVSMTGVVENVDLVNRRFTLLRETIHVDDDTSFGSARHGEVTDLATLQRNQVVQVQADAIGGLLVAREVLVLSPVLPDVARLRGTVVTIGPDAWTVRREDGGEVVTLVINGRTMIAGSPKVGDKVEVVYEITSANAFVAVTILKVDPLPPAPQGVRIHGEVRSMAGPEWTVRERNGSDRKFFVTDQTIVTGEVRVGDMVEVLAVRKDDGTLEALTVLRLRF